MTEKRLRIVICSADVGCGHGRAAAAIALAMRENCPQHDVQVVDALRYAPRWFTALYRDGFLVIAKQFPKLNAWLYDQTDTPGFSLDSGLSASAESFAMRAFGESERIQSADLIVCTHFLCAGILSRLRAEGKLRAKLAVVVTDHHPHAVWRAKHADAFFVASDHAAAEMRRNDVAASRIHVTGIPIDARFDDAYDRHLLRARHALPIDRPVILVTGGGLGLGGLDRALEGILSTKNDAYAVVVCGHNAPLFAELSSKFNNHPRCKILGLTKRMHELMSAADIHVGKPGGLTTSESCARGLPMVLLRPLPGQEERNASAILAAGAAVLHRDPFDAGCAAVKIVSHPMELHRLQSKAKLFGRTQSAIRVAGIAIGLCGATSHSVPNLRETLLAS